MVVNEIRTKKTTEMSLVERPSAVDCRKEPDKCRIQSARGHYSAVGVTMNNFMIFLSITVECVVIDRSGLQAAYDVEFEWSSEPGPDKASIFAAAGSKRSQFRCGNSVGMM